MHRRVSPPLGAFLAVIALLAALGAQAAEGGALDARARVPAALPSLLADGPRPIWVFLRDKGRLESDPMAIDAARSRLTDRALARRAKVMATGALVVWQDLPLEADYLSALAAGGFKVRVQSRWLNAVSVVAGREDLEFLSKLPFVVRLDAVRAGERKNPPFAAPNPRGILPAPGSDYDAQGRYLGGRGDLDNPIDYGGSLSELSQSNVPAVHQLGFTGAGVVVGMLDSGFNTNHEALVSVDVLGRWDFINNDPVVENEPEDSEFQQNHGTMTLSTLGGYKPGQLVGAAFGAAFYLAKTEDTTDEQPIEEDFWVAGIEWLEAQGCDIASSSLAYYDWYTQDDMDGDTAVTTRAADYAVSLGLLVVNSAGNYREGGWGTIAAPADGDSVVAAGAVDETGAIAPFSSPGPSADGRIKPDVCARGVSNHVVDPGTAADYRSASGTSFSCPLTAGICALLLDAKPDATPMEILAALRASGDHAQNPDNDFGWGIIDALAALDYLLLTAAPQGAPAFALDGAWPNPFNPATRIAFRLDVPAPVRLDVLDLQGRRIARLLDASLPAGSHEVRWDGRDAEGRPQASGVFFARLSSSSGEEDRCKMVLLK